MSDRRRERIEASKRRNRERGWTEQEIRDRRKPMSDQEKRKLVQRDGQREDPRAAGP